MKARTRRHASAASSGRWAGRSGSWTKPCSAPGVAHDRAPVGLERLDILRRRVRILLTDDREDVGEASAFVQLVERLGVADSLPRLGNPDHPVEGDDAAKMRQSGRLQRVHPAHAEPDERNITALGGGAGGDEVADHAVVLARSRTSSMRSSTSPTRGRGTAPARRPPSCSRSRASRRCRRTTGAGRRCRARAPRRGSVRRAVATSSAGVPDGRSMRMTDEPPHVGVRSSGPRMLPRPEAGQAVLDGSGPGGRRRPRRRPGRRWWPA